MNDKDTVSVQSGEWGSLTSDGIIKPGAILVDWVFMQREVLSRPDFKNFKPEVIEVYPPDYIIGEWRGERYNCKITIPTQKAGKVAVLPKYVSVDASHILNWVVDEICGGDKSIKLDEVISLLKEDKEYGILKLTKSDESKKGAREYRIGENDNGDTKESQPSSGSRDANNDNLQGFYKT